MAKPHPANKFKASVSSKIKKKKKRNYRTLTFEGETNKPKMHCRSFL